MDAPEESGTRSCFHKAAETVYLGDCRPNSWMSVCLPGTGTGRLFGYGDMGYLLLLKAACLDGNELRNAHTFV